ncbi:MAG TPA: hypothetical protein VEL11_10970 [Candidatus Bathyarchaeia archaeon]|nr:hypothetical protein [Candidatus Bathyarchaeia archaeon]
MIFYGAYIIVLVFLLLLALKDLNTQAMAIGADINDQLNIQHSECKDNSTTCHIISSSDIVMPTSDDKQKGDSSWQANSNNHNLLLRYPHIVMRQAGTPFLLPFP